MKKNIFEELKRIHQLTYGNHMINENVDFLRKIKTNIYENDENDSSIKPDVNYLFDILKQAEKDGGLNISETDNNPENMKKVKGLQLALLLLGYELPEKGIDGFLGVETVNALKQFISDMTNKYKLNEDSNDILNASNTLGFLIKPGQLGEVSDNISDIVTNVIADFKKERPSVEVKITSGNDTYHKNIKSYKSAHTTGNAIDIVLNPANYETKKIFMDILNKYKKQNSLFSYINEYDNPSSKATGGHFHLQYGGKPVNNNNETQTTNRTITPVVIELLRNQLKNTYITDSDIQNMINKFTKNKETNDINYTQVKNWQQVVNLVIDTLEGGYYHPDMYAKNKSKFSLYKDSGETMFGLDRLKGETEKNPAGKKFWELIDNDRKIKPNSWKWNYTLNDNPGLKENLKKLVGDYIKPLYDEYSNKFLTEKSKEIVNNNPALTFHFIYGVWNGRGWFRKFSNVVNNLIKNGITDPNKLLDELNKNRINSNSKIISKSGEKISQITNNLINKQLT